MSNQWVSTGTVAAVLVGLVIAWFYLRNMWRALQEAVRTRDDADVGEDRYGFSLLGAFIAVIASISAIAAYGLGPTLLYVGPVLAVLSALAVSYCLRRESVAKE